MLLALGTVRTVDLTSLKDEFLMMVSHELRTPLTSIHGWARLLRGRKLGLDQQEQALETIERNARAQTRLIEDLLDVSRAMGEVIDSGRGISPAFLPHVFEPFRQADGTTTRRHGGLGLGLAIVRHLVELHGGSVAAVSAGEGRGATFRVVLPIARQDHDKGH